AHRPVLVHPARRALDHPRVGVLPAGLDPLVPGALSGPDRDAGPPGPSDRLGDRPAGARRGGPFQAAIGSVARFLPWPRPVDARRGAHPARRPLERAVPRPDAPLPHPLPPDRPAEVARGDRPPLLLLGEPALGRDLRAVRARTLDAGSRAGRSGRPPVARPGAAVPGGAAATLSDTPRSDDSGHPAQPERLGDLALPVQIEPHPVRQRHRLGPRALRGGGPAEQLGLPAPGPAARRPPAAATAARPLARGD